MLNEYLGDIKEIYRCSWGFLLTCPLLFLIPVGVEFLQHVVEVQIGMYASSEAFKELQYDPSRQWVALLKVIGLSLPGYWYIRYLGFQQSGEKARTVEFPAFGLWLAVFAFGIPSLMGAVFPTQIAEFLGMNKESFAQAFGIGNLVYSIIFVYLLGWTVAWPLGNTAIGWVTSIKLMNGHFFRAIIYMIASVALYMAFHYGLGFLAIGLSEPLVWMILTADSFLVGFLALNTYGASYATVMRAATYKSVSIVPKGS